MAGYNLVSIFEGKERTGRTLVKATMIRRILELIYPEIVRGHEYFEINLSRPPLELTPESYFFIYSDASLKRQLIDGRCTHIDYKRPKNSPREPYRCKFEISCPSPRDAREFLDSNRPVHFEVGFLPRVKKYGKSEM